MSSAAPKRPRCSVGPDRRVTEMPSLFPMPESGEDAWDGLVGSITAPVTKAAESAGHWENILAPLRVAIDPAAVPDPPRLSSDRQAWAYYATKNRGN